jgi:putative acetyltransferase
MIISEVNKRTESLINELLEVWEDSVKATHTFLSNKEIENIKEYVPQALKSIAHLVIMENENHKPIAFMGIENNKLEMLFIKNSERGKGIGKQLLTYGIENYNINELAVNEQNPMAKGFYEHMGFKVYQRNELDDQGNPYPVLYMKLEK